MKPTPRSIPSSAINAGSSESKARTTGRGRGELRKVGLLSLAVIFVIAGTWKTVLMQIGSFLIVDDSLQEAAAIIPLAGQTPFREIAAAQLYRQGWAPRIIMVQGATDDEWRALQQLGIKKSKESEISLAVLRQQGVPREAIIIPANEATSTAEELRLAFAALEDQTAPVILVTSKYHSRRARLLWHHVTGGMSRAALYTAKGDPFDVGRWWTEPRFFLSVVREYLALLNYLVGFPVVAKGT